QDGSPGREDDVERGAFDPLARPGALVEAPDRADRRDARRERPRVVGEDRGASRASGSGGAARGESPQEPRRRGVRSRFGPREGAPRAGGGKRPGATAAAGRGAAARAGSADGGAGDNGEGVPSWRRYGRHQHSLTSKRRGSGSPASRRRRRSTCRRPSR